MLISDIKKLWRSNEIQHFDNETSDEEEDGVHLRCDHSRYFLLFEAAFESAPQFPKRNARVRISLILDEFLYKLSVQ